MKLLIITQKVNGNDPILGFFHRWLEEFAKHCQVVVVICLEKGEYDLPANVRVVSLGKEDGHQSRLVYAIRFLRYVWKFRRDYDAVFVHMNPEYVVLGGWWWRLTGKRIALWYVHRQVSLALRLALRLVQRVLTVTKDSLQFTSPKIVEVGHGIDTEMFYCANRTTMNDTFNILAIGRTTRIKNLDILIRAVKLLQKQLEKEIKVNIVGGTATRGDEEYLNYLKKLVSELQLGSVVRFVGPVPYSQIVFYYCQSDVSVNLCPTGGIDKAVLESMACGVPAIVANEAFIPYLGEYRAELLFSYRHAADLAEKILKVRNLPGRDRQWLSRASREIVVTHHNLAKLIKKIMAVYDL